MSDAQRFLLLVVASLIVLVGGTMLYVGTLDEDRPSEAVCRQRTERATDLQAEAAHIALNDVDEMERVQAEMPALLPLLEECA